MIRVGLVGFGMGGRVFHAPLISSVEGLELAAVVERSTNNAAERYPGIATYRSVEAMLEDESLGLVVVSTPSGTHFEVAKQVLEAGKPVVVDKPMCTASDRIAELIDLAIAKNLPLIPFHNRRWDSDFQTIQRLLQEGSLGRLVYFESRFDRWRPEMPTNRLWKEDPTQGGVLVDLGTHLADQALSLFGKPEAVSADILRERDGEGANDSFTLRLRYPGLTVVLGANCLSSPPRPRFHLRGTKGNYWKLGLDPQEDALNKIARIEDPAWGQEPASDWGLLHVDVHGGIVTRPIAPIPGDYRLFYTGVRDALLSSAPLRETVPVSFMDAWRVARILEAAKTSSEERREVIPSWSRCKGACNSEKE
jgi:scyllo-inositol 2-dehydrogenase (NADP+)